MAKQKKTKTSVRVEFEWVGDGTETIPGVPSRDLNPDESAKWRDLIEATHDNIGRTLYVVKTDNSSPDESDIQGVTKGDTDPDTSGMNEGIDHD